MKFAMLAISVGIACVVGLPGCVLSAEALPTAVTTEREMVVTANPLATDAGVQILRNGGTAADAMIAVQTVLGLVEPQSSGLGGGAFIVYYDAKSGETTTIDARETVPAAATEDRFGSLTFTNAWQSGLSVGVPGVPRMFEYMHQRYGRLPWQRLFVPAITLAQAGFDLTERTSSQAAGLLARNSSCEDGERLFFRDPAAFAYFVDAETCTAKPAGTRIRNKPYADTLKTLSRLGADAFYGGAIASDIATAVRGDLNIPGDMSVDDLANYRIVERAPVCVAYRGRRVCGMGPPSSGGIAVGQILGVIESRPDLMGPEPLAVDTVHLFTQAGRLAFADRNKFVADSDFVTVPVDGLLDSDYLASRASVLTTDDLGTAAPGDPPGVFDPTAPDSALGPGGTSHVSIVDRYGNALSMTSSIESSFGNGVMVRGFLLNNELTDFSFAAIDAQGTPIANRVQANKRPRSSMSPTIVFDADGRVELVTGSPGGARIIGYTAQSIVNVIDFGLDPQEAINVPHFMNLNGPTDLEPPVPGVTLDYDVDALAEALRAREHTVRVLAQGSGLSVIQVVRSNDSEGRPPVRGDTVLVGGADPRRDGTVGGR
ncbi:MAG: gamma-glutamyltransferase family protein [Rhodospirillales bacterium]